MPIATKPKRYLENATKGTKATGTAASEAAGTAVSLHAVANDGETTPNGVAARAAELGRELQTAQSTTKREEIMAQVTAFVANNI